MTMHEPVIEGKNEHVMHLANHNNQSTITPQ